MCHNGGHCCVVILQTSYSVNWITKVTQNNTNMYYPMTSMYVYMTNLFITNHMVALWLVNIPTQQATTGQNWDQDKSSIVLILSTCFPIPQTFTEVKSHHLWRSSGNDDTSTHSYLYRENVHACFILTNIRI